jgi:hypothetical protein
VAQEQLVSLDLWAQVELMVNLALQVLQDLLVSLVTRDSREVEVIREILDKPVSQDKVVSQGSLDPQDSLEHLEHQAKSEGLVKLGLPVHLAHLANLDLMGSLERLETEEILVKREHQDHLVNLDNRVFPDKLEALGQPV